MSSEVKFFELKIERIFTMQIMVGLIAQMKNWSPEKMWSVYKDVLADKDSAERKRALRELTVFNPRDCTDVTVFCSSMASSMLHWLFELGVNSTESAKIIEHISRHIGQTFGDVADQMSVPPVEGPTRRNTTK